jgi:DNA polymerase III epsilon subunit
MDRKRLAEDNLIVKTRTGSHAYGMATPTSDLDIRGVFVGDRLNVVTPFFNVEQVDGEGDTVFFELSKYARLIADQNPTILELLWVDPSDVLFETPVWQFLRENRGALLSRKVKNTYGGYAMQQLAGMKRHSRWLNNPQPEKPPAPMEFVSMMHNFSLSKEFNQKVPVDGTWTAVQCGRDLFLLMPSKSGTWFDGSGALRTFTREEASDLLGNEQPFAIFKFNREEYDAKKKDHDNYWTWVKNRNPERGKLEANLGYDAKNGAHLIRLMRTGLEALTEGVIRVRRPDAAELLSIRRGDVPYDTVLKMAEDLDVQLKEAEARSPLPQEIDRALLGDLIMEMYDMGWKMFDRRGPQRRKTTVVGPDVRERLVVIDVEGTGFHTSRPQVVEVALVEIVGGMRTGRTFHAYIDPKTTISPYAEKIHGLSRAFLRGKPTMSTVGQQIIDFIGDSPVIGHGVTNDLRMVNHDLALAGHKTIDTARAICSLRMGNRVFSRAMSLDVLCEVLEVEHSVRTARGHGALTDATLLADCILKMSAMPGVRIVEAGRLTNKERRSLEGTSKSPVSTVYLNDEGKAHFSREGTDKVWTVDLPAFPVETHEIVIPQGRTAVLVVRREEGATVLDNPIGPAVIKVIDDEVRTLFYVDGVRCHDNVEPERRVTFG